MPALAAVGVALLVNITSFVEAVHGLFEIVHLNVALVPTRTPVTAEVGEAGVVMKAVPLTTLHAPVPTEAMFPASVKFPLLQLAWLVPAAAAVGVAATVNIAAFVVKVPFVFVKITLY